MPQLSRHGETTSQKTGTGLQADMIALFVLAFFAFLFVIGRFSNGYDVIRLQGWLIIGAVVLAALTLGIVVYVRYRLTERQLKRHDDDLRQFCAVHSYAFGTEYLPGDFTFGNSSLVALGKRDRNFRNFIEAPDWKYCEFSYAIYRRSKTQRVPGSDNLLQCHGH